MLRMQELLDVPQGEGVREDQSEHNPGIIPGILLTNKNRNMRGFLSVLCLISLLVAETAKAIVLAVAEQTFRLTCHWRVLRKYGATAPGFRRLFAVRARSNC